jgi:DNA ligase-1
MKKTLPILYSRGENGKILTWEIEIDGGKYRVTAGAQGAKKVISEWTEVEQKNVGRANQTSVEEQALAEAQAKWKKKARTGYTQEIKKIDNCMVYVEPMTAHKLLARLKKIDFKKGVLVQNKYNGHRCVARIEGGKVVLRTRTGKLYYCVPHIVRDLEKFFEKAPEAVLDGELFNNELRAKLNEISSLIRKGDDASTEDLAESEKLIRFYVYDGYDFTDELGQESDYILRKKFIDENLPRMCKYCLIVKTEWAYSMEDVDKIYFAYVADGQEGAIIRLPFSPYENKRSNNLLKYKPQDDSECVIIKLNDANGNWSGKAKTATVRWNGKEFDATFKGTMEQAADRWKNQKPWINSTVTFLYNGLTGLGVPNSARIDPDNCFQGDK